MAKNVDNIKRLRDIVTKMEIEYAPQYTNEIVLDISDDE